MKTYEGLMHQMEIPMKDFCRTHEGLKNHMEDLGEPKKVICKTHKGFRSHIMRILEDLWKDLYMTHGGLRGLIEK